MRGESLVLVDPARCPCCTTVLDVHMIVEVPLLRHGGYGAGRLTRWRQCPLQRCGWSLTFEVKEVHP